MAAADIKSEANTSQVRKVQGGQNKDSQHMTNKDGQLCKKIKTALLRANNNMRSRRTRCEFAYHEETNRISIKIFDRETKEVIREIPPEETLEMIERLWELAGLLIDEKR
jgi:flagellar protein FlaG